MRRLIALFLAMALLVSGCSGAEMSEEKPDGRIQIVATLFPQYDFARQIAGTFAEVTLLLPPGVASHSFEPTPDQQRRPFYLHRPGDGTVGGKAD